MEALIFGILGTLGILGIIAVVVAWILVNGFKGQTKYD